MKGYNLFFAGSSAGASYAHDPRLGKNLHMGGAQTFSMAISEEPAPLERATERSPSPASVTPALIDRERLLTHSNPQNRPDPAGQVHGVVSRISYPG